MKNPVNGSRNSNLFSCTPHKRLKNSYLANNVFVSSKQTMSQVSSKGKSKRNSIFQRQMNRQVFQITDLHLISELTTQLSNQVLVLQTFYIGVRVAHQDGSRRLKTAGRGRASVIWSGRRAAAAWRSVAMGGRWVRFMERAARVKEARVWREKGGADLLFIEHGRRGVRRCQTRHGARGRPEFAESSSPG